jgi:hypothetical protein
VTTCFASDFVRQERQRIPSHQTACHTSLEADHDAGSERELRYSQALIEVPAAAGAARGAPCYLTSAVSLDPRDHRGLRADRAGRRSR